MLTLDLQARANAATAEAGACAQDGAAQRPGCHGEEAPSGQDSSRAFHRQQEAPRNHSGARGEAASGWEHDSFVEVPVTADGLCNAVLVWFEADLGGGHSLSSWHWGCDSASENRQPSDGSAAGTPDSDGRGCRTGSGSDGERRPDAQRNGVESDAPNRAVVASSWSQGIQYLDGVRAQRVRFTPSAYDMFRVKPAEHLHLVVKSCQATLATRYTSLTQGKSIELRVRQEAGQLHFASEPPQRRPCHAYLPRWHFDMVRAQQDSAARQYLVVVRLLHFAMLKTARHPDEIQQNVCLHAGTQRAQQRCPRQGRRCHSAGQ